MEKVTYERHDRVAACDGWILWSCGDVAFLLIPDNSDWISPMSVVVASDDDQDGIYQKALRYWLADDEEATLVFLRQVFDGTTMN